VAPDPPPALSARRAEDFAELALSCVHRPYPNKVAHVLASDADVLAPQVLTPAFYGCFDWHSAVHGHWLLARVARRFPEAAVARRAEAALQRSLTAESLAAELAYVSRADRVGFERPYGLAWLLALGQELREWDSPAARRWSGHLQPLERLASERLARWVPQLSHPIRVGEHAQTAFAFGLALDWADVAGDEALAALLRTHSVRLYGADRDCPLTFEPSGHDFLSPCLGEADLMRRVLPAHAFARWLSEALPDLPRDGDGSFLRPATPADRSDGKLVHLDGLNLSRAWMLEGIAGGLPPGDPRIAGLRASAGVHARAGLAAVSDAHYEGSHWLGTFAVYLTTQRGRRASVGPAG
jgi:hypothetical protein